MTKKELAQKMREFIAGQPDYDRDDWYVSSKGAADAILTQFAEFLGINLEEQSSATTTK